jgi:hypothetical protein
VGRLRSDCAGHCGAAEVDAARNKLIVADVSLGVAVVSATIATVLFVRGKREVSLAPLPSGAVAAWTERF